MVLQNHKAKLVLKTPRLEDKKLKKTESIPTGNNVTQQKQKLLSLCQLVNLKVIIILTTSNI